MHKAKLKFRGLSFMEEAEIDPQKNTITWKGKQIEPDQLNVDAPVSGTIYGAVLNYKGALSAMGESLHQAPYKEAPKAPVLYIKPINTIIAHHMPIPLPAEVAGLEMGAALGIVIGRTATRVKAEDAWQYIAGFTVVNDVSIPHESIHRPAISQKARDGFCPVGPWIMERDAVSNPNALNICVYINGELRQENNTSNLIRPIECLLADVTDFMTLNAGDTLLVGVPEGAPLAKAGDCVRIEIEGVGALENTVVNEDEVVRGKAI